jgi:arsenate reductase
MVLLFGMEKQQYHFYIDKGGQAMNVQIFGTKKCFDTKKAERYFKERKVPYQLIDMKEKGMSKGEFNSVRQAVGGADAMLDENCRNQDVLALIKYIAPEDKDDKILENQEVLKTPIVRNGKQATIGYQPDTWKDWK